MMKLVATLDFAIVGRMAVINNESMSHQGGAEETYRTSVRRAAAESS